MFVPFRIPQTGYRPVVHMLFCFVLSVSYYPILKVKTLLLVSMSSVVKLQTGETVKKENVLLNITNIAPKIFSLFSTFFFSFLSVYHSSQQF